MTGMEMIAKIRDGELPPAPIQGVLGMDLVEASEGSTVFALTPRDERGNPLGVVHGGVAGTMLDSCTGAAVHITAETGRILATGRVVHRGSRVPTAEGGDVRSERDGKLLAHGTSTCLLL